MTTPHLAATASTGGLPLTDDVVTEFQLLMSLLDLGVIDRDQWDRLQAIVVIATLQAGDSDSGVRGHRSALAMWRESTHFDGRD
jgi:hypothetical protein